MSEDITEIRRIPEHAKQRLEEMRGKEGGPPRLFTSDLSVNEFLMIEEAGFEPVGFVMGCSFFHIGIQWTVAPHPACRDRLVVPPAGPGPSAGPPGALGLLRRRRPRCRAGGLRGGGTERPPHALSPLAAE